MNPAPFYPKLARANLYQVLMILTPRDRPWVASGRKQAAGDAGHLQGLLTPPTRPRGDRACVFSELSDRVARPFRCPASLRIRLLAERSEKTSIWVSIIKIWY
jgi:hypothetical protein